MNMIKWEIYTDYQTDLQTYRHTDWQTHIQTDKQTHRLTNRHIEWQTDIQNDKHTYRLTNWHTDWHRHIDWHADIQTDIQTYRLTYRHTDIQTVTESYTTHNINDIIYIIFLYTMYRDHTTICYTTNEHNSLNKQISWFLVFYKTR